MKFESMPTNKNKREITPDEQKLIKDIDETLAEEKDKEVIDLKSEQIVEGRPIIELKKEQVVPPTPEEIRERLLRGTLITPKKERPEEKRAEKLPPEVIEMLKTGELKYQDLSRYMIEHKY
ncbi:MAG: hypothetical protein M1334_01100, partial [Patescibacteria group bacterium]|nr:hypothetical protein [Patescibacteria group bacterium]